jgi:hypothetical protein
MNSKPITAYQCGACSATYTAKVVADLCCMPKDCACGATIPKTRWRCEKCETHANKLKWECADRKPCPKDGWLYSALADEYFQEPEDFMLSREFDEQEIEELVVLLDNFPEFARRHQVYLCKAHKPEPINLNEHFEEYCFEDQPLPDGWEFCEEVIKNWIEDQEVWAWPQMSSAIAWNGEYAK